MKWRSTILLFLIVAAVGAFIWFYERDRSGTREREAQARRAVTVRPESVSLLQIESSNLVIRCMRVDEEWLMEEPVQCHADRGEIRRVLTGLQELPKGQVISEADRARQGLTLHDYGLALPRATIRLVQQGRERAILVGGAAPLGASLYVMETNRQDIVVTSTNLLGFIPDTAERLRSRILMPAAPIALHRMEVRRAAGFLELAKNDAGTWRIEQPDTYRADAAFVRDLAVKFLKTRIHRFVADDVADLAPFGLDEPVARVTLWPAGEAGARTLDLGSPLEEDPAFVYARTDEGNSVYAVPAVLVVDANLDAAVLRDRRLMRIVVAAIGYVEIRQDEAGVELVKDDAGSWSMTRPVQRPADDAVVWDLVNQWATARVETYVTDDATNYAGFAAAPPARQLVLARHAPDPGGEHPLVEGKNKVTAEIYATTNDTEWVEVKLRHDPALYGLPAAHVDLLRMDPLEYYDRLVLQLVPEDIRKIEIQRGDLQVGVERDAEQAFRLAGDGEADGTLVEEILRSVSRLRVQRFVAEDPEDLSAFGLDPPQGSLTLGLTGEAGIGKTLVFGDEVAPAGVYAMIRGQGAVFVLARDTRDRLLSDLRTSPAPPDEEQEPRDGETQRVEAD